VLAQAFERVLCCAGWKEYPALAWPGSSAAAAPSSRSPDDLPAWTVQQFHRKIRKFNNSKESLIILFSTSLIKDGEEKEFF
jgi:hypothetical protein